MSSAKVFNILLGLLCAVSVSAFAAIEDYTWSFSGASSWTTGENEIYIAVNNATEFSSAVIEVHFDPEFLEIGTESASLVDGTDFEKTGERMDSISVVGSKPIGTSGIARLTILSLAETEGYTSITVGTGDIVKLVFRVKSGVTSGNTTLELVSAITKASLATHEIEIQGEPAPELEDFTWSLSGASTWGEGDNEISIGVENDAAFTSAVIDVYYDPAYLEIGTESASLVEDTDFEKVGERMDSISVVGSKPDGTTGVVRLTILSMAQTEGYTDIAAGSGDIVKLVFRVKSGVYSGNTTLELVSSVSEVSLATHQIQIQILTPAGNPKDFTWSMSGVMVAGSTETEVFVQVKNTLWFSSVALDVFFDTTALEVKQPLEDNIILAGRAGLMNLAAAQEAGTDYVRLTVTGSELDPTNPRINAGKGTVAKLKFSVKTPLAGGESTTLQLKLSDGTEMASLTVTARDYTGPSPDLNGDGKNDIFDLIGFIPVLVGNSPSSLFSDVNGDGKTDVMDFLEILRQVLQQN